MLSYRSLRPAEQVQQSVHNEHMLGRHLSRTGVPHVTPLRLPGGLERYETDQGIMDDSYVLSGFEGPSDDNVGHVGHVGPTHYTEEDRTQPEEGMSFGSAAKEVADSLTEKRSCMMTIIAISLLFIIVLMLLIFGLLVGLLVTLSKR